MAIDFFEHQDAARRQTGRLVFLFVLAVAVIIAAVYGVATAVLLSEGATTQNGPPAAFDLGRLALVATAVLVVISAGSLYKTLALGEGGEAVARMLGGRLVNSSTTDLTERRLLNVVEEMAVAAGMPVPPVYVMDDEPSINAFAAGLTPGDAVIGVSRGSLDHLDRDQLQGVIGHEFSHILNGDMRLNIRLIGLVHGILVLALIGQLMFRAVSHGRFRVSTSRNRDDKGGGLILLILVTGVALWVIGSLGVLLGRIIKCAISRQREFLADASAVQFTRNPDGIAGALKKIGGLSAGSRIENPNAEQAAHMFFGQGVFSFSRLLATHPPLEERIQRLDPSFVGDFRPEPDGRTVQFSPQEEARLHEQEMAVSQVGGAGGGPSRTTATGLAGKGSSESPISLSPDAALASVGSPRPEHVDYATTLLHGLPPLLADATRDPFSARAVIYALLIDENQEVAQAQLEQLDGSGARGTAVETLRLLASVRTLGRQARVPLVDLTFPALRRLSPAQYRGFRRNVEALVRADQRVNLFEYALQRMLLRHLDRTFLGEPPSSIRYHSLDPLYDDSVLVLSTLARLGHQENTDLTTAFAAGVDRLQSQYPGERVVSLLDGKYCTLTGVNRALDRIARAAPDVKRRVLDACATCIANDGVVTAEEGELLRAIADSLDCPMPPLPPTAAHQADVLTSA